MGTGEPPEMCSLITSTLPRMLQVLKESISWTAGMSTRAVVRELNVQFSAMGTSTKDVFTAHPTGLPTADQV